MKTFIKVDDQSYITNVINAIDDQGIPEDYFEVTTDVDVCFFWDVSTQTAYYKRDE